MAQEFFPERRATPRARMHVSCAWGATEDTPRSGTVTSLSRGGCFLQTKAVTVAEGQPMHLKLWLPSYRWLPLAGTVIYHRERVGFGLKFAGLTAAAAAALDRLVADPPQEEAEAGGVEES